MLSLSRIAFLAVLFVPVQGTSHAQTLGDDPRLGAGTGRLRYRIVRGPSEEVEVPDIITMKNGSQLEAYFLAIYGDTFVFYVKETERSWLREVVSRSDIQSVDFHQYLDKDPVAPGKIEPARKQPVPKDDFLSGVFSGLEGRHTRWRITFLSEIDKLLDNSEDATDYGTVEVESSFSQRTGRVFRSHEVRGRGKYYLFQPDTVNNKDWVLVLSEVVETEVDRGDATSLFTTVVPDETFIVQFSPERDSFRLQWSNLGAWTWSALTQVNFERVPEEGPALAPSHPRAGGEEKLHFDGRRLERASPRPPASSSGRPRSSAPLEGEDWVLALEEPARPEARRRATLPLTEVHRAGEWWFRRWRVEGWRKPSTFWDASGR